jgi:hypothetical protein
MDRADRAPDGKFLPGISGNPSGKPKSRKVTEALKRLMELSPSERSSYKPTNGFEEAAMMLLKSAFEGDGKFSQRVHAIALIYDRIEGKSDISDSEADALKAGRRLVMDMPTAETPAPPPQQEKKPN